MIDSMDARWLRLALAEAARGHGRVEPNPMVGAVIVRDRQPIGIGHHALYGTDHAEVSALKNSSQPVDGATIYVTLEPCSHYGKTPPCAKAIVESGISRVVVATADPNPKVNGNGIKQLRDAGLSVELLEPDSEIAQAAYRLNLPFFKKILTGRPFVIAKWAMSLDGRMALASGDSKWISNEHSRALVHELRGRMDAIIVGSGTVHHDDPMLTVRPPGPRTPVRVVVDSNADISLSGNLLTTAADVPVWVFCSVFASPEKIDALRRVPGCRVLPIQPEPSGHLNPLYILDLLGKEGFTNVLLEGGARLSGAFLDCQAIDQVQVYIAPVLFGGPPAFAPMKSDSVSTMDQISRLLDFQRIEIGSDSCVTGIVPTPWLAELGYNG